MKILLCADVRLGAVSLENLDSRQSRQWQAARKEKLADLMDQAARQNTACVALFGRIFGQERVPEAALDTLFQAVQADDGRIVLAFLSAGEFRRVSCRKDIPGNLRLISMEAQGAYREGNVTFSVRDGAVDIQAGDSALLRVQSGETGRFTLSGLPEAAVIPSFEPMGFEEAQDTPCGFGILEWTAGQPASYRAMGGSAYAYRAIELKIQPADDRQEILRKISQAVQGVQPDTFLRVTLTGRCAFGLAISGDALKGQLQSRLFFVEVYDNTVMDIDEAAFENDISLRSEFVRLALQDTTLSESERGRLISCGWKALNGGEVSAE